jgi:hypothetical protein
MKVLAYTGTIVLVLCFFASCKKDWICQCTDAKANTTYDSIINQETRLSAKAKCQTYEAVLPLGNTVCSLQ